MLVQIKTISVHLIIKHCLWGNKYATQILVLDRIAGEFVDVEDILYTIIVPSRAGKLAKVGILSILLRLG